MPPPIQTSPQLTVPINALADGYFEMTDEGRFTVLNDAMCRLLEDSRGQLMAVSHPAFLVARGRARRKMAGCASQPSDPPVEHGWVEVVGKDGRLRWLAVTFTPLVCDEGRERGLRGLARDATGIRNAMQKAIAAEKQMRRLYEQSRLAEQRYQAFLQFLPVPVMVMEADQSISYLNPAFENTFGWTLEEIREGLPLFVPEDQILKTATGKASLIRTGALQNLETQRFARDGRVLDVIYDGATYFDENQQPAGLVISLRDITRSKRDQLNVQTLYKISTALHSRKSLDELLTYISRQVQHLLHVGRAHVILLDEEQKFFYFRAAAVEDPDLIGNLTDLRIPVDRGVMGEVYRTREPLIVNDFPASAYATDHQTHISAHTTRNMVHVPIWVDTHMIGLLCAVNKRTGDFTSDDVAMLTTIAGVVALPIENTRITARLHESYREISSLSKAKDCLIDRLSHELRTPLAVITASLHLLTQQEACGQDENSVRILARCRRNLDRLVDMQYQLADIVAHPRHEIHRTLGAMLEMCADELESLVSLEAGEPISRRIREKIDRLFAPREVVSENVVLGDFVAGVLERIKPLYYFRHIDLLTNIHDSGSILIPPEVLEKIVVGLVKNSIENTPDGGQVTVAVTCDEGRAVLTVKDTGVGITDENKALIFENYFTTGDTNQYATRKPFEFNAGGRGFDLLRIKLFSEKYNYKISMASQRCPFIARQADRCPGSTGDCTFLQIPQECHSHGGTTFTIAFASQPATCGI